MDFAFFHMGSLFEPAPMPQTNGNIFFGSGGLKGSAQEGQKVVAEGAVSEARGEKNQWRRVKKGICILTTMLNY